jgi:hypothetical protein
MMAFGTALALGGTLVSRRIMGPTESATHLYIIIIGRSGRGKDWPLQCGERLMAELGLSELVGPGEWASSPGIWKRLQRTPTMICFVDEMGDELALVNAQGGNPYVAKIIGTLKKCYNAFSIQNTAEKVGEEGSRIVWPSPSVVGASTPQKFFGSLKPTDLESGFANRLLTLPSQDMRHSAERQPPRNADVPPKELIAGLKSVYRPVDLLALPANGLPPRELVDWGPGAEEVYFRHSRAIDALEDRDPKRHLLGLRSCENAIRAATVIATLRGSKTVDVEDIQHTIELAKHSLATTCSNAEQFVREYYEFPDYCDHVFTTLRLAGPLSDSQFERKFGRNQRWGGVLDRVRDQLVRKERIRRTHWQSGKGPEVQGWEAVPEED